MGLDGLLLWVLAMLPPCRRLRLALRGCNQHLRGALFFIGAIEARDSFAGATMGATLKLRFPMILWNHCHQRISR